jgi:hypothetical protein
MIVPCGPAACLLQVAPQLARTAWVAQLTGAPPDRCRTTLSESVRGLPQESRPTRRSPTGDVCSPGTLESFAGPPESRSSEPAPRPTALEARSAITSLLRAGVTQLAECLLPKHRLGCLSPAFDRPIRLA